MTPVQQLSAAVVRITEGNKALAPYFGAVLRGLLRRQMSPEVEAALAARGGATLAVTSDGVLLWSAAYVAKKSTEELAWDLMHETMHVLLKHFERADALGVTPETAPAANAAQDACINEELRKTWPTLGKDAVYPETLQQPLGLVFEARYRLLLQNRQKQPKSGVGRGQCGSCATGGEGKGKSGGADGRSEAEMDRIRKQVAHDVKAHVQANGVGSVPGALDVWADTQLAPPKVDWRTKLGKLVRGAIAYKSGAVDLTYQRPSRRQAGVGYGVGRAVLPAMHAPVPRIAIVFDTSGSMNRPRLVAAASELPGIISATGASITMCVADTAVHGLCDVFSIDAALGMLRGGGGTDMGAGLRALAALPNRPSVVIVLTDGEIPPPGDEPPFSVIWCIVAEYESFVAPFGETVFVGEEAQP